MKVKLLATISSNLSHNTRNALVKGVIVGIITAIIYLAVVVITTPNLPPSMAIGAALKVNGIIIIGLAIGVGIQVFTSTYSKGLGCRLDERRKYKQQHKDIWRVFRISRRTGSSGAGTGGGTCHELISFILFPGTFRMLWELALYFIYVAFCFWWYSFCNTDRIFYTVVLRRSCNCRRLCWSFSTTT